MPLISAAMKPMKYRNKVTINLYVIFNTTDLVRIPKAVLSWTVSKDTCSPYFGKLM